MFQFTRFASLPYIFRQGYLRFTQGEFPHSEIFGSKLDWQLPEAYGSLPPPSSPLDATGIHQVPFSINHKFCWLLKHWALINTYISKITNFYITISAFFKRIIYTRKVKKKQQSRFLVEMSGFEPLTYRVQNGRSANWATPPWMFEHVIAYYSNNT